MSKLSAAAKRTEQMIAARRAAYFGGTGSHTDAMLFSTDTGGSSPSSTNSASKVVTIAKAAEACGLPEDVMRERVAGRCPLKVVDGELSATQGHLQQLANDGVIPKPSDVEKAAKQTAAADRPATDPKAEKRTASMADALAIDASPTTPTDPVPPRSQPQFHGVTAKPRQRRRLGQPRRWGQH